jgi:hypothetical protein
MSLSTTKALIAAMIDERAKTRLAPELDRFRKGLEQERAEGATDVELLGIVSASVNRACKQLTDPEMLAYVSEQFAQIGLEVSKLPIGKRDKSKLQ